MPNIIKRYIDKFRMVFEAYGPDSVRNTFEGELNYEAGKLFFVTIIAMLAWLPYIHNDIILHQYPALAVSMRIGLTLLSIILIALKFSKCCRNRSGIMMLILVSYLNFASAVVTATAGENAISYIGGFCFILMISTFAPLLLKDKYVISVFSFAIFFAGSALTGLDFSRVAVKYSINDLFSAFTLSIFVCHILNKIKYVSWQRQQKFMELIQETMSLADKAETASKAKSDFLAKMSHEIRTPMNAITGMAELALHENLPDAAREHVTTIKQAGANLLSIINDILDFSKIESGKLQIIPSNYQFSSLVHDVVSIIRMRIVDSNISFVVNIDCNVPNSLFGDETRIRQILLNILNNAVKYTKKGFVSFSVSGKITEDTVILTIDVTDSGSGIKPEDLKTLFNEFVQVNLTANKGVEGTGLGLAITKRLLNAMDGDISVQSEYSEGSTFTITLRQKIRSPEPIASIENPEEKSVLVYERNTIYADSIICTVDNLGVECGRVENDTELREKLQTKNYAFLFVSYSLLGNARNIMRELKSETKIAVLTEFGNAIADMNLSVLAMPVHSVSVANILNGLSDGLSYSVSENVTVRFNAPKARILIVDDITTNLKVAEGLMLPYKMQIDSCLSGAAAIKAVSKNSYDLVFMDHMMPEMDGIEATKCIRELKTPHSKDLPIVALTANAISGTKEMFLSNGFDDFLSKPIDIVKLNAILVKWLPKDKQEKLSEEAEIIDINDYSSEEIKIKIEGVDIKKGILMTGGKIENYMRTLAVFYKDGIQKIEEIEKCLETKNYPLYTTYVHALKSALISIGANELSENAKVLEIAGNRKDKIFIDSNNSRFLINLKTVLNNINTVLNNAKKPQTPVDFEILENELCKLKEAFDVFDFAAIDEAVGGLQKFVQAPKIGDIVESILQNTVTGKYEDAGVTIDNLLRR